VTEFKFAGVGLLSKSFNLFELFAPQLPNFVVEGQWVPLVLRMPEISRRMRRHDYKQIEWSEIALRPWLEVLGVLCV
jgi:hypothetical protein